MKDSRAGVVCFQSGLKKDVPVGPARIVERRVLAAEEFRLERGQFADALPFRFGREVVGQREGLAAAAQDGARVARVGHEEFAADEERHQHRAAARHAVLEPVLGDQIVLRHQRHRQQRGLPY